MVLGVAVMEDYGQTVENESSTVKSEELETRRAKNGQRRQRVSQACNICRSRKDKCDGARPACSTCTSNGRICSYDTQVKKRGLPEGYVRGLEKLWGLAIREVEGVEENVLAVVKERNDTFITVWTDEGSSDKLVESWRKSQISRELEKLVSSSETPVENSKRKRGNSDTQTRNIVDISGTNSLVTEPSQNLEPASGWPSKATKYQHLILPYNSPGVLGTMYDGDQRLGSDLDSILGPSNHPAVSVNSVPTQEAPDLPQEAWHLLDIYFSYTHSWLPIIEKHDLLRTSYQYSKTRNAIAKPGRGTGDYSVLWAAIAFAKFQQKAIHMATNPQNPSETNSWTAKRIYSHARSLIPDEEGTYELGHVQALLILGLINLGLGHLRRAWVLVGHAVRIAIDTGLDRPLDETAKALAKSRMKHVFLGCFVLDTLIAARLNHRPHLQARDVERVGFIEEDGLEEWDPWSDCLAIGRGGCGDSREPAAILSTFNRLVKVLQVLNETICSLDPLKGLQLNNGLLEKLQNWNQIQLATNNENILSNTPHQYHLNMAYLNTLGIAQLYGQGQDSQSINIELCTRTVSQMADLFKKYSNAFSFITIPPTFEYFLKTAFDLVSTVKGNINNTQMVPSDLKLHLDISLDSMEHSWPAFELLKEASVYKSKQQTVPESEAAYDLISSMSRSVDTAISSKTSNSFATYDAVSPQVYRSQTGAQIPVPQASIMSPGLERTTSFGRTSVQNLPLNIAADTWSQLNQSSNITQFSAGYPRSLGSEIEPDPTFHEFAALDTMEWSENWDQSLVNLGFTDRANMNRDFLTMSREPDPLFPNNVFQQLVANSNAEAAEFLDGSIFGGIGVGTDNLGQRIGAENEGFEAGQILHSLRTAENNSIIGKTSRLKN